MEHNQANLLKDHSLNFLEMALRTDRIERIEFPDGYGTRTGECGDTVEFFIMVKDNLLETVSFRTQGCINTVACSNTVAKFAEGKTPEQAWEILPEHIIDFLQTLPNDHYHCAELSIGALYLALNDLKKNVE